MLRKPAQAGSLPFPTVQWDEWIVTFEEVVEDLPPETSPAVVIFAKADCGYVLANVPARGWCTPSGRLEAGETHLQAARRETREEIGAEIGTLVELGRYVLRNAEGNTLRIPAYAAQVERLGAIPPESESQGVKCVPLEELQNAYYRWDSLIARVWHVAESAFARVAR